MARCRRVSPSGYAGWAGSIVFALVIGLASSVWSQNGPGRWKQIPNDAGTSAGWDSAGSIGELVRGGGTHLALLRERIGSDSAWVLHWSNGPQARLWRPRTNLEFTLALPVPVASNETNDEIF